MRVTYDPSARAGYIGLIDPIWVGGVKKSVPVPDSNGSIVLDLDAEGHLVGIELLDPALFHPAVLAQVVGDV